MGKRRRILAMMLFLLMVISPAASLAKEDIVIPEFNYTKKPLPDLPAFQFVEDLKAGWNLGNTFDASNANHVKNELAYESAWVGVKTDKKVFEALKNAGFGAVRIPVSWHNHVSGEDFTISAPWLARVKEVVDLALDMGLYVILNTHHDNEKGFYYPDEAHFETSSKYIKAIWSQVAPVFKEYDERLVLESMNEPRLSGTDIEWWLNPEDPRSAEAVQCINKLNQVFVDTVRASGGYNVTRYLLVPGYAASVQGCMHPEFQMPRDADGVEHSLLLSVHAYTPYEFALQAPGEGEKRDRFEADNPLHIMEIASFMDQVHNKFTPLNVPVVIGEFGARDKNGNLQSRVDFTAAYVALARARGITCFWWDNHGFQGGGELFGLLNRYDFEFRHPEIVEAMIRNAR